MAEGILLLKARSAVVEGKKTSSGHRAPIKCFVLSGAIEVSSTGWAGSISGSGMALQQTELGLWFPSLIKGE